MLLHVKSGSNHQYVNIVSTRNWITNGRCHKTLEYSPLSGSVKGCTGWQVDYRSRQVFSMHKMAFHFVILIDVQNSNTFPKSKSKSKSTGFLVNHMERVLPILTQNKYNKKVKENRKIHNGNISTYALEINMMANLQPYLQMCICTICM